MKPPRRPPACIPGLAMPGEFMPGEGAVWLRCIDMPPPGAVGVAEGAV